jgi:hypothetical protein
LLAEEFWLLGYNAMPPGESKETFRRNISLLFLRSKSKRSKKQAKLHLLAFILFSSTLKMEEACSSETLVDFYQTTRRDNPENWMHQSHYCQSLKFYKIWYSCKNWVKNGSEIPVIADNAINSVFQRALQLWKLVQIYSEGMYNVLNCCNVAKYTGFYLGYL